MIFISRRRDRVGFWRDFSSENHLLAPLWFALKTRLLRQFLPSLRLAGRWKPKRESDFAALGFFIRSQALVEAARQRPSIVDTYGARFYPPADNRRVVRKPELSRPFPTESRQSLKCPTRRSVSPPLHPETGMAFLVLENCNPHDVQLLAIGDKIRKTAESNTPERGAALVRSILPRPGFDRRQTVP